MSHLKMYLLHKLFQLANIHTYTNKHTHIYVYIYIYIYVHIFICICMYIYLCVFICKYIYVYVSKLATIHKLFVLHVAQNINKIADRKDLHFTAESLPTPVTYLANII